MAKKIKMTRRQIENIVRDTINERLNPNKSIFAPNHYCIHHGGVHLNGKVHLAEAVRHNYNAKLGRVTHYDMRLANGTILENVPAEAIQVTNASLAEGHHGHPAKRDQANKDYDGDGQVESGTDEYMGSKDKAIKKAMKSEGSGDRNDPRDTQGRGPSRQRAGSDGSKGDLEEQMSLSPGMVQQVQRNVNAPKMDMGTRKIKRPSRYGGIDPMAPPYDPGMGSGAPDMGISPEESAATTAEIEASRKRPPVDMSVPPAQGIDIPDPPYMGPGSEGYPQRPPLDLGSRDINEATDKDWYDNGLFERLVRKWAK